MHTRMHLLTLTLSLSLSVDNNYYLLSYSFNNWLTHLLTYLLTHSLDYLHVFHAGKFTTNRLNAVSKSTKQSGDTNGEEPMLPSKYAIKIVKKATLERSVEKYSLTHTLTHSFTYSFMITRLIRNEIHLLTNVLSHPNVIKLYEVFDEVDKFYLVFECLDGGELFQRVAMKEFFLEEVLISVTHSLTHMRFLTHLLAELGRPRCDQETVRNDQVYTRFEHYSS